LKEAHRLGFTHAVIPDDDDVKVPKGMRDYRTSSLDQAIAKIFDPSRRPPPRDDARKKVTDVIKLSPDDISDNQLFQLKGQRIGRLFPDTQHQLLLDMFTQHKH